MNGTTVLEVTPLVSIMKDQVEELTRLGLEVLKAFAIGLGKEEDETVIKGVLGLHRLSLLRSRPFLVSSRNAPPH